MSNEGSRTVGLVVDGAARAGFNTPSRRLEFYSPTMAEWSWVDSQNVGATTNQSPQTTQSSYSIWNLRAGIGGTNDRWQLMGYVENVGDEAYCQVIFEQPFAAGLGVRDGEGNSLYRCVLGVPRTYGARVNFNF